MRWGLAGKDARQQVCAGVMRVTGRDRRARCNGEVGDPGGNMITARVKLTQPLSLERQFVATTGSGHHVVLDDAAGATGAKPIELVAVALAGCTAFDVITILRQKHHQRVTGYEVSVEADQADRPPQVFVRVRIHHVVTGLDVEKSALEEAIRVSEEKYCSVGAMIKETAAFETTYEIREEPTGWIRETQAEAPVLAR